MNILKKIFSKSASEPVSKQTFPWKTLTSVEQLDSIAESSQNTTVVIFKHSTQCHISKMVLSNFESEAAELTTRADFYFLDLLQFRGVSNAVADRYNVVHQSPQLLIIKKATCVYDASHHSIQAAELEKYLD
ncbi:MAG TPA: bacillithiol system redox-active protein YtxJ [Flavobacteriaceae bacterium]|nr:bacillithiol system redox-active protein YtxJ [Flavobacteriaceae bacterium]